jgi:hypothetical protein
VSGADALRALLDPRVPAEKSCERLAEIDLQAKRTAAKVMDAVYGTFVTPFDRVDIKQKSGRFDEGVAIASTIYSVQSDQPQTSADDLLAT